MPPLNASQIMDKAAALLNDSAKGLYTYDIQMPYLNMALQDLRKDLQLNNSPVTDTNSVAILIPIGTTEIPFYAVSPAPKLPVDLIEIQKVWYSNDGLDDTWSFANNWTWESNKIILNASTTPYYLKIQYIRNLFTDVNNPTDPIEVLNADSYLQFRTAGHLAMYVAENPTRAGTLYNEAGNALDKMLGIDNKGKQRIFTRRLPFRNSYKNRGY